MPNCLDPEQARHLIRPDLGSSCLQKLSADDNGRQRIQFIYEISPLCFIEVEEGFPIQLEGDLDSFIKVLRYVHKPAQEIRVSIAYSQNHALNHPHR